jgi:hypothetical protein
MEEKMSVEQVIKDKVKEIGAAAYVSPEIVEKKLNGAVSSIAQGIDPSVIVAIVDTTILGSAKEGIVFTGDTFYYRGSFEKPVVVPFTHIGKSEHKTTETKDEKGKVTTTKTVTVFDKEGNVILSVKNPLFKHDKFSELLEAIIAEGGDEGDFQTSQQAQQLKDMAMPIRVAYIKTVCNYLHHETECVDNKEYAEIISLIVRNDIDNENRFILRQYLMNKEELEDIGGLINFLDANVDEGSREGIHLSLVQDVVKMFRIRETAKPDYDYNRWTKDKFVVSLQKTLKVTDEQIAFFLEKLQSDEDIIAKRQDDNQIKKTLGNLASKATLIGIPAAALYLSGSVWIYSGGMMLMTGAAGVLGPLALGVAAGYGAYKGIKYFTGLSEIENNGKREMMLQGIIRNSQKSLNYLIEDVNYIAQKLSDELTKGQTTGVLIQKLKTQLVMLSSGAATMSKRVSDAEREAIIAKLPRKLDKTRFEELTSKPTEKKFQPIVYAGYIASETKWPDGKTGTEYALDLNLSLNRLEELHGVLDGVGYFNMKDAGLASAKGLAKNLFNKAKETLSS